MARATGGRGAAAKGAARAATRRKYADKLICGEALATLRKMPAGLADLGVTSPPYNKLEKFNGGLVGKVVYGAYKDKLPEAEYQRGQVEILDELFRVIKPGGSFFYNHKIRWLNGAMFHPMDWLRKTRWIARQEIVWDRAIAANIRGWRFWQVEERVYWLYKPRAAGDAKGQELDSKDAKLTSIWRGVPEGKNPHPAPFPLWLPARVILSMLRAPGGLVLDPYMGSGTTAVAAKLLGHNYVGIDLGAEYLAHAAKRIANRQGEAATVEKEKALHVVRKTFSQRKAAGEYKPKAARAARAAAKLL